MPGNKINEKQLFTVPEEILEKQKPVLSAISQLDEELKSKNDLYNETNDLIKFQNLLSILTNL